jgi:hypothetical protein
VVVAVAACSAAVPGQVDSTDPAQVAEVRRTFDRRAADVLGRALDLLVTRGEMGAGPASEWSSTGLRSLEDEGRLELTSESVARPADTLRAFVVADQRRFVGDAGGRYYLTVRIIRGDEASTAVEVVATIVAATAGPGPIGGRPVRSNGTLERAFLDALAASLG